MNNNDNNEQERTVDAHAEPVSELAYLGLLMDSPRGVAWMDLRVLDDFAKARGGARQTNSVLFDCNDDDLVEISSRLQDVGSVATILSLKDRVEESATALGVDIDILACTYLMKLMNQCGLMHTELPTLAFSMIRKVLGDHYPLNDTGGDHEPGSKVDFLVNYFDDDRFPSSDTQGDALQAELTYELIQFLTDYDRNWADLSIDTWELNGYAKPWSSSGHYLDGRSNLLTILWCYTMVLTKAVSESVGNDSIGNVANWLSHTCSAPVIGVNFEGSMQQLNRLVFYRVFCDWYEEGITTYDSIYETLGPIVDGELEGQELLPDDKMVRDVLFPYLQFRLMMDNSTALLFMDMIHVGMFSVVERRFHGKSDYGVRRHIPASCSEGIKTLIRESFYLDYVSRHQYVAKVTAALGEQFDEPVPPYRPFEEPTQWIQDAFWVSFRASVQFITMFELSMREWRMVQTQMINENIEQEEVLWPFELESMFSVHTRVAEEG